MKRAIILLVVLNFVMFAYFQLSAAQAPEGHQPLPLLHSEKIKILSDKAVEDLPVIQNAGGANP